MQLVTIMADVVQAESVEIHCWSEIVNSIYNAPLILSMNIPQGIVKIIVDGAVYWNWDKTMSFGINLDEDCLTLAHHQKETPYKGIPRDVGGPMGWQTVRGNICLDDQNGYVYEWDIEATDFQPNYGDLIIGILADDGQRPNAENNKDESFTDNAEIWAYHSTNTCNKGGYTVHQKSSRKLGGSVTHDKELDELFKKGDVIGVIYDSGNKTLKFKKNGKYVRIKQSENDQDDDSNRIVIYDQIKGSIFPFVTVYSTEAEATVKAVRCYNEKHSFSQTF